MTPFSLSPRSAHIVLLDITRVSAIHPEQSERVRVELLDMLANMELAVMEFDPAIGGFLPMASPRLLALLDEVQQ